MASFRRVVLCADDFGLTPGVSRGIVELAEQGRLSATSAITNGPWWPRFASQLQPLRNRVAVGLHLNLTTGAPLGTMPGLAPSGLFPTLRELLQRALTGGLPGDEIGQEIERQLQAFEDAFGQAPAFVDGHQHVHVLPVVRSNLLEVLQERRAPPTLWLRDPSDSLPAILQRDAAGKALFVRALAVGFGRAARMAGFSSNRGFSGFSSFDRTRSAERLFRQALAKLGPRPVVMCHPGYIDEELRSLDPVVKTRPQELAYLRSDPFADLLRERGVALVSSPA